MVTGVCCFTLEAGHQSGVQSHRTLRLVRLTGIALRLCSCNIGQRESHKTFIPPLLITAVRLCIRLIWVTGSGPNAPCAVGHGYQQDHEQEKKEQHLAKRCQESKTALGWNPTFFRSLQRINTQRHTLGMTSAKFPATHSKQTKSSCKHFLWK